jgi:hypothetical protein
VCRFIVDRGHDVQLHVHPGHVTRRLSSREHGRVRADAEDLAGHRHLD